MPDIVPVIAIIAVFGIPLSAIWTHHLRELAKIRANAAQNHGAAASADVKRELEAIRQEMATLRDTTTKFDMSFDAALSRLEDRMDRSEAGLQQVQQQTAPPNGYAAAATSAAPEPEAALLRQGR